MDWSVNILVCEWVGLGMDWSANGYDCERVGL